MVDHGHVPAPWKVPTDEIISHHHNRDGREYYRARVRDATQRHGRHGEDAEGRDDIAETSSVVSVADWTVSLSQLRRLLIAHEDRLACKAFDAVFHFVNQGSSDRTVIRGINICCRYKAKNGFLIGDVDFERFDRDIW